MKKFFYFLVFIFLLCFSCNNNIEIAKNSIKPSVIDCFITTSSDDFVTKLFDENIWLSSSIPKDDILFFEFYNNIFIHKISIEQAIDNIFDKITKIKVYTNKGITGIFDPNNIIIDDSVLFVILLVEQTKDFYLTNAYLDNQKYSIAFERMNKKAGIKNIIFYENDTNQIIFNKIKQPKINNFNNVLRDKKIIDYSSSQKSIILKKNGQLLGIIKNEIADTLYFGNLHRNNLENEKFLVEKCIFSINIFKPKLVESQVFTNDKKANFTKIFEIILDFEDDYLVDIKTLDTTIIEDIKYATEDNFMKKQIYECPFCLLRYRVAKDLILAVEEFYKMGYRVKLFDCYRPHSAQFKLWEIMPNKNFVANPETGSIHNRGGAIDVTITDMQGKELDMGTPYDFFGREAFSINLNLPDTILQNRKILWSVLNKYGFKNIKTEWWHLSHYSCIFFPITDEKFPCE